MQAEVGHLLITDVVVSPSYMIARSYQGRLCMHHIDAYRVSTLDELAEVGELDFECDGSCLR